MNKESLNLKDYLLLLIILIIFVAMSLVYEFNQNFSYDQIQMLLKGFHASFNNEYLPFGNEASSMGNVPGMLSSWLVGFPLEFYIGLESIIAFQLFFRVLAILIFANALSLLFSRSVVMLGTFLFALGPWYLYHTMIYNPAFIHFGSAITLNCLIRLRYDKNHKGFSLGRVFSSIFLVLSVGFILQLHYSWTVMAAICGIMWLRRDIKISYLGVLIGLAIFALSMVPYVQEVMVNKSLLTNPEAYAQDRYLGYGLTHVYPIFKGILYWLRFGSLLITNKAIFPSPYGEELSTMWTALSYLWVGVAYLIGIATVLFSAYSNYFAIYRFRLGNSSVKFQFIRGLTISSILAVVIASAASPVTLNFWQISVVLPLALIPVLALISVRQQFSKLYFVVALFFFVVANPIAAMSSDKFYYKNDLHAALYQTCLMGFNKEQCTPYANSLSEEKRKDIESQYPKPVQSMIDRVIKGLIPTPEENAKQQSLINTQINSISADPNAKSTKAQAQDGAASTRAASAGAAQAKPELAVPDQAQPALAAPAIAAPAPAPTVDVPKADATISGAIGGSGNEDGAPVNAIQGEIIIDNKDGGNGSSGELIIQ